MRRISVTDIRRIEIEQGDPERSARFYTDVWNLTEVARAEGSICLRGTASDHHILSIHPADGPARMRAIVLNANDKDSVDALHGRVVAGGLPAVAAGELSTIDGGYGFSFRDPGQRRFTVVCGAKNHADDGKIPDRPHRVTHVNINTTLIEPMTSMLTECLGMRLVGQAGSQYFFNADSADYCSLVLCKYNMETVNHVAYEMKDLESVMRGAGRMSDNGYPIEWGPGRHGAGDNVFAYFAGPEEFPLEYTSELMQIDDSYEFHGPDYWKWPPGRLDQWGVTPPHTNRWKRIQTLYGFR